MTPFHDKCTQSQFAEAHKVEVVWAVQNDEKKWQEVFMDLSKWLNGQLNSACYSCNIKEWTYLVNWSADVLADIQIAGAMPLFEHFERCFCFPIYQLRNDLQLHLIPQDHHEKMQKYYATAFEKFCHFQRCTPELKLLTLLGCPLNNGVMARLLQTRAVNDEMQVWSLVWSFVCFVSIVDFRCPGASMRSVSQRARPDFLRVYDAKVIKVQGYNVIRSKVFIIMLGHLIYGFGFATLRLHLYDLEWHWLRLYLSLRLAFLSSSLFFVLSLLLSLFAVVIWL